MKGPIRLIASTIVTLSLFAAPGCASDDHGDVTEIPKSQAVQELNATFTHISIPGAFTPLAATVTVSGWGHPARMVAGAFAVSKPDLDAFVVNSGAAGQSRAWHGWMKDTASNCPSTNVTPITFSAPTPLAQIWLGRGIFERCAAIEYWTIPQTQFADTARSTGFILAQARDTDTRPAQLNVVIATTIA